jgi:hypothetical protein
MNGVRYPVATTAEAALAAPIGRAEREREARTLSEPLHPGFEARFVTELAGPGFSSREAALDGWAGFLDDERPGRIKAIPPEDRYCDLREIMAPTDVRLPKARPIKPVFRNGRRWPDPKPAAPMLWRIAVSFWKVVDPAQDVVAGQAREARRRASGENLTPEALRALMAQPLRPLKQQQPLDIGLFEIRAPEDQSLLLPDE